MKTRLIQLRINLMKAHRFIKVYNDPMSALQVIDNSMTSVNAMIEEQETNEPNMKECKVCGTNTKVIFNIKFKETPICDSCATAIFLQQAKSYVENQPKASGDQVNNQPPICPECKNPYPHSHRDGSYSCEECGHKWKASKIETIN